VGGYGEALQLLDDADYLVQLLRRLVLVAPLIVDGINLWVGRGIEGQ
jgi:hypothetical protein